MGAPGRVETMMKQADTNQEHLTEEQTIRYQSRSLEVAERRAVETHLAGCGACRRTLLMRLGPVALPEEAAAMHEPLHLEYEELTAYLDSKLDEAGRAHVESHSFICSACSNELDGLQRLDAQLVAKTQMASAAERKAAEPKVTLGQRIAQFFAVPGRTRDFGFAFGAAVAGVLLIVSSGSGSEPMAPASGGAARLIDLTAQSQAPMHLGGYFLVAVGVAILAYSLWKRR